MAIVRRDGNSQTFATQNHRVTYRCNRTAITRNHIDIITLLREEGTDCLIPKRIGAIQRAGGYGTSILIINNH